MSSASVSRQRSSTASTKPRSTFNTRAMTTSASITQMSTSTTTTLSCYNTYNRHSDETFCRCEGHTGRFSTMSSTSGMTGYQPCAWTTLPTTHSNANAGPITSTKSNGDILYCPSAHWNTAGQMSKPYCVGSVSVMSTDPTLSSSFYAMPAATPAMKLQPYNHTYYIVMTGVGDKVSLRELVSWEISWAIWVVPNVMAHQKTNWCKNAQGELPPDPSRTARDVAPHFKFRDMTGRISQVKEVRSCTYSGGLRGTMHCPGKGQAKCEPAPQTGPNTCFPDKNVHAWTNVKVRCQWGEGVMPTSD
ncbi:hypothetical protein N7492_007424 [Penicillium capsulatum]|uniref:Uncharacterized protein n=1 Tax=Penicillium capsulatum TaxID=69766 RepID=A0A9W9LKU0_9EURO|nr:hypothetical protein N7492_007424 [Penicillium capsulatum]